MIIEDETWVKEIDEYDKILWMKCKEHFWVLDDWKTIVRIHMGLPLNDEMIKQTSSFEGDLDFMYKLQGVCSNTDVFAFNDKQVNFMVRLLLSNQDVPSWYLKEFAIDAFGRGKGNKEIEAKLKETKENGMMSYLMQAVLKSILTKEEPNESQRTN